MTMTRCCTSLPDMFHIRPPYLWNYSGSLDIQRKLCSAYTVAVENWRFQEGGGKRKKREKRVKERRSLPPPPSGRPPLPPPRADRETNWRGGGGSVPSRPHTTRNGETWGRPVGRNTPGPRQRRFFRRRRRHRQCSLIHAGNPGGALCHDSDASRGRGVEGGGRAGAPSGVILFLCLLFFFPLFGGPTMTAGHHIGLRESAGRG